MNDSQSLARFADMFAQERDPSLAGLGAALAGPQSLKRAGGEDAGKDPGERTMPAFDERDSAKETLNERDRLALVRERGRALGRGGGVLDALPVALTTGMLGNLPDYPPAAYAGIKAMFAGEGFGKGYDESLEEQRGIREGLAERFPWLTAGGNMAGAVAPGARAAKFVNAPTAVGRIGQATALGALIGGAQGFATGEGVEGRARSAMEDAALGAALGAAGQTGSQILSRVRRR